MELKDKADGVRGHFCIGRRMPDNPKYWHYWNEAANGWRSAGTLYIGREVAQAKLRQLRKAEQKEKENQ